MRGKYTSNVRELSNDAVKGRHFRRLFGDMFFSDWKEMNVIDET